MTTRITYDTKTIDVLIGNDGLQPDYTQEADQNRSGSGKTEVIVHHHLQVIELDAFFVEATYRDLLGWWSWALRGNAWSLAMDTAKIGNTTLDGSAAAAQKVIPLTATAAFAAGDVCLIRSANRLTFELVVVDTISAGVSVTAVSDLKFAYVSGDAFRHYDYYPSLLSMDDKFNPDKKGFYYRHTFKAVENV
jgi:hypothetical protein